MKLLKNIFKNRRKGKNELKEKDTKKTKTLDFTNIRDVTIFSISIAVIIIVLNIAFVKNIQIFSIINLVAGIIAFGLPIYIGYGGHYKNKRVEEIFPVFLRDVNKNIKVGMTLPQAIRETTTNNYGVMTPFVKEISAKIEWGIPFEKALKDFSDKIKSPVLDRVIRTIIETHQSGGEVGNVLEAISKSVESVEKIKKERSSTIYSQMINGYFIFFVFLGIIIIMSKFLFPVINLGSGDVSGGNYNQLFLHMIIIEGLFAGLAIGKMSEASFLAGAKHSLILVAIGYASFTFFAL